MLNVAGGLPQNFPHSKRFEAGDGRIRPGQSTVVTALDGSGDVDTLLEAIKRLPAAGGVIYLKEGTYELPGNQITLTADISLVGAGRSTVLSFTSGGIGINMTGHGSRVANLKLAIAAGGGSLNGIKLDNVRYCLVQGCWLELMDDKSLLIEGGAYGNQIINNSFLCETAGIHASACYRNLIQGNYFELPTANQTGIKLFADCDRNRIIGNYMKETVAVAGTRGIHIVDNTSDRNVVVGNIADETDTPYTDAGTNTVIAGNIFA